MRMNDMGEFVDGPPRTLRVACGERPWQLVVVERLCDEGRVLRWCDVCGRPMTARGRMGQERKYCSFGCRQEANRYRARMRRRRK